MPREETKSPPVELSEDDVQAAGRGKSEEVLGSRVAKRGPVELKEGEVEEAAKGRSEEVLKRKHEE